MFKILMASLGVWGLLIGFGAGYLFAKPADHKLNGIGYIDTTEPPDDFSRLLYYFDLHFPDEDTPDNSAAVSSIIQKQQEELTPEQFSRFAMKAYNAYDHYMSSAMLIYCLHTGETPIGAYMGTNYMLNKKLADIRFDPSAETFRFPETELSEQTRFYLNHLAAIRMNRLANANNLSPKDLCLTYAQFGAEDLQPLSFQAVFPTLYDAAIILETEIGK